MTRLHLIARMAGLVAFALGIAVAWVLVLPPVGAVQPVEFNHARHRQIACATCHVGVTKGTKAGIPSGSFCAKCHATAPAAVGEDGWARITSVPSAPWIQLTRLPEHVRFSHERHVGAGRLECASCHGDIGTRTAPASRNPARLDMNTCLGCHQKEDVTQDCAACHR